MERKTLLKELPEKWVIKRTADNCKMINDWANKQKLGGSYGSSNSYIHSQPVKSYGEVLREDDIEKGFTEINTQEFKHLVLGQKLLVTDLKENECIHVSTEEEDRQIRELLHEAGRKYVDGDSYIDPDVQHGYQQEGNKVAYRPYTNSFADVDWYIARNHIVYPASYFINNNTPTMEKEIIGYVLKPECEQYREAVNQIVKAKGSYQEISDETLAQYGNHFTADSSFKKWLEEAGVLQLWFNEVYKEEKKYQVGDWVTVVTPDDIDLSSVYTKGYTFKIGAEFNNGTYIRPSGRCVGIEKTSVRSATNEEIANAQNTVLTLGDKKTKVTIRKGSIEAEGATVKITRLEGLVRALETIHNVGNWSVTIPSVKIGCCTFSKEEIDQIISEYNKLNQ